MALSPAEVALARFYSELQVDANQQCTLTVGDQEVCNISDVNVEHCSNLELQCCNQANVAILSCTSAHVEASAVAAALGVINPTTVNSVTRSSTGDVNAVFPGLEQEIDARLKQFFINAKVDEDTEGLTMQDRMSLYLNNVCQDFTFSDQTATVPTLYAYDCSEDVVNVYNNSDIRVRCAAGALTNLFPNTPPAATPPWYKLSQSTSPVLIAMASLAGLLLVLVIALAFWRVLAGPAAPREKPA